MPANDDVDDPLPQLHSLGVPTDSTHALTINSDLCEPLDQYQQQELNQYILAIRKGPKAQKQHLKAKALTHCRLQKQTDWPEWQAAEFKMLDQYANVDMYGPPVTRASLPKGRKIIKLLLCYVVKPDGQKKARNVCNGQPDCTTGKVKITFAETYAAGLSQLEFRLITTRCHWIAYGADATNAFAFSPPPQRDTVYIQADPQYVEWYNKQNSTAPIDPSYVLPVHHALQGHPESPRLWEGHINTKLNEMGFCNSSHAPCLYHGTYHGSLVLILRWADDFNVAAGTSNVAKQIYDEISNVAEQIYDEINDYCTLVQDDGPV